MLVYCDSCILIYFFDHTGQWQNRVANRLAALASNGDTIAVSDLVRLECRVGPIIKGDAAKLAIYDKFFARPDVRSAAITTAVFDRATAIRAKHRFRLADSLHLAAAVEAACDCFLTNDNRLSAFQDVRVDVLI